MKKTLWLLLFFASVVIGFVYMKFFKPTEAVSVEPSVKQENSAPVENPVATVTPEPQVGSPLSGEIVPKAPTQTPDIMPLSGGASGLPQPPPRPNQVPVAPQEEPSVGFNPYLESPNYEPPPPPPNNYVEPEIYNNNPLPYDPSDEGDFIPPDVPPIPPPSPVDEPSTFDDF